MPSGEGATGAGESSSAPANRPTRLLRSDGAVEARFTDRQDGVVDVDLGPDWPGFTEALQDAVTTRAPHGDDGGNPCTYWIDRTLAALATALDGEIVASGNATDLRIEGHEVVAHAQYDTFDDERMPREDFVAILSRWRAKAAGG